MSPREQLIEPLLTAEERATNNAAESQGDVEASACPAVPSSDDDPALTGSSCCNNSNNSNINNINDAPDDDGNDHEHPSDFSVTNESWEMFNLGFPLAVSFFCRMGMASTDSAFVGHIHDGTYSPETYLAAAVLSDMCVSIFTTPPLAFNQVLNALVGQAVGSGNPKMAGVWLQQSIFWLTMSMLPCLVGFFYVEPLLQFLGFPDDVSHVAGTYAKYNIYWPVANGIYQCMRFYFQAQGLPRPAMYNNIAFLFINALLNWIFVFGGPFRYIGKGWKGLGFIGAAISLSISRTSQSVVYFFYMFVYKKHHLNSWPDGGWAMKHHTVARTTEFLKQSLPNLGTLLFSVISSQATTVLVGRLGQRAIAASAALSTVSIPWSGTMGATTSTISGVRVGYHLGRGDGTAAKRSAWMVMHFISIIMVVVAVLFVPLRHLVLTIATDDEHVLSLSIKLIPAMLVSTYLNLLVGNITSGVFGGMGRPIISTILSFGFELPMSIGGVAIYILVFHGNLLGVYWWNAISGAIEVMVVLSIMLASDWDHWALEAQRRQEARPTTSEEQEEQPSRDNAAPDADETEPLIADEEVGTIAESNPPE